MSPTSYQAVLAPNGTDFFQGEGDNGRAEKQPASNSEAEGQSQSVEDGDEDGGEEESNDASGGQPESAEDRESGGGRKGSTAESTSAKDDSESGGEWTRNMGKEAKRGPARLEVGGASVPTP